MDVVLQRERIFFRYGCDVQQLKHKTIHSLAFRLFTHAFVNEEERKFFVGDNKEIDSVFYIFKSNPPVTYANMRNYLPPNAAVGTVFMYILFYDTKKNFPGVVCAPVKNNLEFGSKHITIVNYINETRQEDMDDLVFVQAGELLKQEDFWEFNHFSGSFSLPRIDVLEDMVYKHKDYGLTKAEVRKMLDVTNECTLTKKLLMELTPFAKFEFTTRAFYPTENLPLTKLLETVGSPKYYPYVIPSSEKHYKSFEKAVAIIGTFTNLREMKGMDVQVTSWAVEMVNNYVTTSLDINDVDNNVSHGVSAGGKFFGRTTVLPVKTDLKKALSVLRQLNAKRLEYGKGMRLSTNLKHIEMFDLAGKSYSISYKFHSANPSETFRARLEVVKFLASSTDEVYLCKLNDTDVVMKVFSLYPFDSSRFYFYNYEKEEAFYKSDIISFAIPGCGAMGIIYPYLGITISDIPLADRLPLYSKFKKQFIELFLSMVIKEEDSRVYRTLYNDYKPENTTLDKDGNFKLIDYDESGFTPRFYGIGSNREFSNQLFGVLMVVYWFKTDENPFDNNSTGFDKLDWAQSLSPDFDVKVEFVIALDGNLSVPQKIAMLKKSL